MLYVGLLKIGDTEPRIGQVGLVENGPKEASRWELGFAVPLMFICLVVPSIRDRASLVAAGVGGAVSLVARDAPNSTGLLIGALAGVTAGMAVKLPKPYSPWIRG